MHIICSEEVTGATIGPVYKYIRYIVKYELDYHVTAYILVLPYSTAHMLLSCTVKVCSFLKVATTIVSFFVQLIMQETQEAIVYVSTAAPRYDVL